MHSCFMLRVFPRVHSSCSCCVFVCRVHSSYSCCMSCSVFVFLLRGHICARLLALMLYSYFVLLKYYLIS